MPQRRGGSRQRCEARREGPRDLIDSVTHWGHWTRLLQSDSQRWRFLTVHCFWQDEMDHEKQARSDATELKLKVLDDKLLRAQITEEEKLRPLNEQIERLMEELSAERLSREVTPRP